MTDNLQPDAPRARVMPEHDDEAACAIGLANFADAMRDKLAAARDQGRTGWNNPAECPIESLAELLLEAISGGDLVSIGNFAMMLHARDPELGQAQVALAFREYAAAWGFRALSNCIGEARRRYLKAHRADVAAKLKPDAIL